MTLSLSGCPADPPDDGSHYFAYVANFVSNNVSAFTINASSGALTAVAGSPFAAGAGPCSFSVDPAGKFVFVANNSSGNVSAYAINTSSGVLTAVAGSPFSTGTNPESVTITTPKRV